MLEIMWHLDAMHSMFVVFFYFLVLSCLHSDKQQKIYKSQWKFLLVLHADLALPLDLIKQ